jgi:Pectate lyase superfamily protein
MASFNPFFIDRQFSDTGSPLAGGLLYTYVAGAGNTAQLATYQDPLGAIPFSNPIVLNAGGIPTGNSGNPVPIVWLTGNKAYKFILTDSNSNVIWEEDNYYSQATLDSVTALTAISLRSVAGTVNGQAVYVEGTTVLGDGGQGWWYWSSSSIYQDDLGTTILPTGHSGAGRWLRFIVDKVNVKWFNAIGNGTTDDKAAFTQAALAAANYPGGISSSRKDLPLYAPPGKYLLSADPTILGVPFILPINAILYPTGFTLDISPVIDPADISQHFDITYDTNSHVRLRNATSTGYNNVITRTLMPEWFGVVGNGTTSDTTLLNEAIYSASLSAAYYSAPYRVLLTSGSYGISGQIVLKSNVWLVGSEPYTSLVQLATGFIPVGDNGAVTTNAALKNVHIMMHAGSTDKCISISHNTNLDDIFDKITSTADPDNTNLYMLCTNCVFPTVGNRMPSNLAVMTGTTPTSGSANVAVPYPIVNGVTGTSTTTDIFSQAMGGSYVHYLSFDASQMTLVAIDWALSGGHYYMTGAVRRTYGWV